MIAATTGTGGSEIDSVNSACGFVSSVISGVQFSVMIFDAVPLLLDTLSGLLELVCFTSNIATLVISGLRAGILNSAVALLLLAVKG